MITVDMVATFPDLSSLHVYLCSYGWKYMSYANRTILCLPSVFFFFHFILVHPHARAYFFKSSSGKQLLCKAK